MGRPWTTDEVTLLAKYDHDGLTARAIGLKLFRGRDAVIGKLNRMKGTPKRIMKPSRARTREEGKAATREKWRKKPGPRTIMQLDEHDCRWPLWADDAPAWSERLYCGKPTPGLSRGCPYCTKHERLKLPVSWRPAQSVNYNAKKALG